MRPILLFVTVLIIGCGTNSIPRLNQPVPDASGNWSIEFMPSASSPGGSTPSGIGLGVTFSQNGESLSGTVTSVSGEPSACFPNFSASGTTFILDGQVAPPVEAGTNLFLTVSFALAGTQTTMQMINLSGVLNTGSTIATGTFLFASGPSGCTQGTFSMTKMP